MPPPRTSDSAAAGSNRGQPEQPAPVASRVRILNYVVINSAPHRTACAPIFVGLPDFEYIAGALLSGPWCISHASMQMTLLFIPCGFVPGFGDTCGVRNWESSSTTECRLYIIRHYRPLKIRSMLQTSSLSLSLLTSYHHQ